MGKAETRFMLYCHINRINYKMYFGITKNNISQRYHGSHGYKGCTSFYNAIKKYGWDNFEHIVVLDNLSREDAEFAERFAIAHFNTTNPKKGYNIQSGGKSTGEVSEEGHRRLVEAASGENAPRRKPVVVFDLNGNKIEEFVTTKDANAKYKSSIIWKNANRYSRAINGYFFRFKSIVGDSEKMDDDDLANSPLKLIPKNLGYAVHHSVVSFDRKTGKRVKTYKRIKDALFECNITDNRIWKKGYLLSEEYVFKYEEDVIGVEVLDLSFLDVQIDHGEKEVNQYSSDGELLKTYPSLRNAADETGLSYKSMSQCASHKTHSCGGFVWRYVDDPIQFEKPKTCEFTRRERGAYKYKPIDQIDLSSGKIIKTFPSMTAAANAVSVSKSSIYSVASHVGNCVSAAGYGWRYHQEELEGVG